MRTLVAVLALTCAGCVGAPPPVEAVRDTSYREADGDRAIQLAIWVPASPEKVYRTIATIEGWKTWAVPSAFGEVKLNGVMETSYSPTARPGDPNNIKQQFLALVPDRLVVFRTIQTPQTFPHPELYKRTVAVLELTPEAGGAQIMFTHQGFGTEPGFAELYDFFVKGDRQTMDALRKVFAK